MGKTLGWEEGEGQALGQSLEGRTRVSCPPSTAPALVLVTSDLGLGDLCPGGPAAPEPEGQQLAPHLHRLDHKRWPVVCLPGWEAAGLW